MIIMIILIIMIIVVVMITVIILIIVIIVVMTNRPVISLVTRTRLSRRRHRSVARSFQHCAKASLP